MRLTRKNYQEQVSDALDTIVCWANINPNDVCKFPVEDLREQELKLGQLEDIMEKYSINSAEELEHIILNDATGEQSFKDYIKPYRDIEKELGIDLFTLFKALKKGIYVKNRKNEIRRVSCNIGLVETGGHNSLGLRFQDTNYKWRYLVLDTSRDNDVKDYGETWALTKEELE